MSEYIPYIYVTPSLITDLSFMTSLMLMLIKHVLYVNFSMRHVHICTYICMYTIHYMIYEYTLG